MMLRRTLWGSLLLWTGCTGDPREVPHDDKSDDIGTASESSESTNTSSSSSEETSSESDSTTADTSVEPCEEVHVMLQQEPARIMLVLDKSGSMRTVWDHDQDPNTASLTRWSSLISVVDALTTEFDATIEFGAQLFPSQSANGSLTPDACVVESEPEVPVAANNRAAILAGIPSADSLSMILGGTPTTEGIRSALAHLKSLENQKFPTSIVLVTDGAANCDQTANACNGDTTTPECKEAMFETYDPHLEPLVSNAFEVDNIPTYVVGIDIVDEVLNNPGNPPINPHDALNQLAVVGGTARANNDTKFFNAENQGQLLDALQEIAGKIRTCTIDLTVPPNRPPAEGQADYVSFELKGVEIEHLENPADCATKSGWIWLDLSGPYTGVELCGSACDQLKVEGKIDGEYDCIPPD